MQITRKFKGQKIAITLTDQEVARAAEEFNDKKLIEEMKERLYQKVLDYAKENVIEIDTELYPNIKENFIDYIMLDTVLNDMDDFIQRLKEEVKQGSTIDEAFNNLCYDLYILDGIPLFFEGYLPVYDYLRHKITPLMKKRRIDLKEKETLIVLYLRESVMKQKQYPFDEYSGNPKGMKNFLRDDLSNWFINFAVENLIEQDD